MNKDALYHSVESEFIYPLTKDRLVVRFRSSKGDLDFVELYYVDKYRYLFWKDGVFKNVLMAKSGSDVNFDYYEALITYDMISMGYYFKVTSSGAVHYYGNGRVYGVSPSAEGVCYLDKMFTHALVEEYDLFTVPEWAKGAIVYQIFPERFYRGDNYIDDPAHAGWYDAVTSHSYHGGTLQGIIDKLGYLKELGVTMIYLNPVFKALGNHKYVTEDYYTIDPCFGTNELFRDFVKKCHDQGIRVILDGAFSSTGTDFFAFKDLLENQENSLYKDWYEVKNFPVTTQVPVPYKSFAYYPLLPKLRFAHPEVRQYILDVMLYWIKEYDIDGWRLDSANEVPHRFWQEARMAVKEVKPDVLLVGEIWYDSRSWLRGDELDTVMNYLFFTPVLDYIAHNEGTASQFAGAISQYLMLYKKQVHHALWNLIDSHDTSRFLYEAKSDVRRLKIASLLQFTMPGSPCIYYGDEAGMSGANDPHCRGGMLWDESRRSGELFIWYKQLSELRKKHDVLRTGDFSFVHIDDSTNCFGYVRRLGTVLVYVYVNMSNVKVTIQTGKSCINLFTGECNDGEIVLEPLSGCVFSLN